MTDAPLDDLTIPAAEILKLSPDAAKIETLLTPWRPTPRIIHIADWHYGYKLQLGAAYELAVARPWVDILPAENQAALEAALDADHFSSDWITANEAREDAIVANLLQVPCAVIILGGGHDLSRAIKRLGGGRCDYLKVRVAGYSALKGSIPPVSRSIRILVTKSPISRGLFANNQTALVSLTLTIFFMIVASRMFAREAPEDEETSTPGS